MLHTTALALSLSLATASPLSIFGGRASVGGDPTFCFPSEGSFHVRQTSLQVRSHAGGTVSDAARTIFEQFVDNEGGKTRVDYLLADGGFTPTPLFMDINDYNAKLSWSINYRAAPPTCEKRPAPPKPAPNTDCGAPDGVTFASTGTQGPVDVTIFRSVQVTPEYNVTYTWHVAGDVPTIDSILHFSASFQNETFADYQRTEVEDVVRSR